MKVFFAISMAMADITPGIDNPVIKIAFRAEYW
jgi:hypothetical protein